MKHLKRSIPVVCLVAAACLLPKGAFAQANPRIGTWKLDVARSTYQQGEAPGSETRTYLATDDGGIQMAADAVLPSGDQAAVWLSGEVRRQGSSIQRRRRQIGRAHV